MDAGYLAKVLADLGPETCDRHMFLDILQQLAPMLAQGGTESQLAAALAMMSRHSPSAATDWNAALFGAAVLETFPKIDINQVVAHLDYPQFSVTDPKSAEVVFRGLRAMTKDFYSQLHARVLMKPWTNTKGQLSLLFNSLLLPPETLNYSLLVGRKVVTPEDFASCSPAARSIAALLASQTWNCLDLFEFTAGAIDTEQFEGAKPIFELASRQCPELLCIALASMDPPWNSINKEILAKLACGFLLGQPSSSVVLPRVWALNPNVLLFCIVEMHRRDPSCLSRLLDVAQELKILPVIMDAKPYSFTLDLACLASRRQHLNFEKWLSESLKEKGDAFMRASVEFLVDKVAAQFGRQRGATTNPLGIPVPTETLSVFVKVLLVLFPSMSPDIAEQFKEVHRVLAAETGAGTSTAGVPAERGTIDGAGSLPEMTFASDVEEEVNNFFDRIFAREVGIPEVIEILRQLKASASVRDQQVFACFLHNIFDEYRFFAKYPDNELNITAVLFGQLINCQLVAFMPLGLALRCVLEALKKPPNQKLFRFGLQALLQFHTRLPEWPQYCAHLGQIPHLQQVYPDLYAYIRSCIAGSPLSPPAVSPSSPASARAAPSPQVILPNGPFEAAGTLTPPAQSTSDTGNPLFDAAEKQKFLMPSEGIRDKILFIINNLASTNIESKAGELAKVLDQSHFAWLAQYLVVKRASIEPNYHTLYLDLLDILQIQALQQQVLSQTFSNIYSLLRSAKIVASSSERSLLKNLGMWLGGLTLARDQPILYRDLSLKDLLIEAFVSDRLIAIVPFVCKVTEQCAHSRAFQPENPWLMAILRLLAELYNYADLKLNLKFEIEVLCKNLQVELHLLEPSNLLKQKVSLLLRPGAPTRSTTENTDTSMGFSWVESPVAPFISFNTRMTNLRSSSVMKKILCLAVEYAIRDLSLSVAQRSFSISVSTTRALVGKDFAAEPDENLYRKAASNMAPCLAANLALVTARESLKSSIVNNIRVFSQWAGIMHLLNDTIIDGMAEDNLEIACAYVEKVALDRARHQIDVIVDTDLQKRTVATEAPRLSLEKFSVYEEYQRKSRPAHLASLPPISLEPITQEELERLAIVLSNIAGSNSETNKLDATMSPGVPATEGSLDAFFETVCLKFVELVSAIESLIPNTEFESVSKLPMSHEIRSLMKQIILLASSSPIHRDELCLLMSQRLMQALYRTDEALYLDVIILLLIKIFECSSKAAKEVTTWVVHSTDERKYSVSATAALFGSGLIYVLDFDGQLAKQIEGEQERAITFAVELIRKCVFVEPPVAAPYDFVYSLEALGKIVHDNPSHSAIEELLQDIAIMVKAPQPESQLLRDQITFCFTDWFRLCQYPSISEKLISSFVAQLFQRRFLKDEASARPFFQICTELSIELYVRQRRAPAILAYRSIDAFARLVGQIIKFHPRAEDQIGHMHIITIVHSVSGMILAQGLEQGLDYLQRPFARLFASMAAEILRNEDQLDSWPVLENLSSFYSLMSPKVYPNFAFGWFELIVNRHIMPRLLLSPQRRGWPILVHLLTEYLEFSYEFLQNYDANEATSALYRGVLRCLLLILHDSPEFFVVYGKKLSLLLPPCTVQLRNTVLAAVPADLNLPDPLNAVVRTTVSHDARLQSRIVESASQLSESIKALADKVLRNSTAGSCRDLLAQCRNPKRPQTGHSWDVEMLTRVVEYMGMCELSLLAEQTDIRAHVKTAALAELARCTYQEADQYGKYFFTTAVTDQLTYPSAVTSYFYCLALSLFSEAPNEAVKEVITRVLLERLIVHRPHPWGVMVTFIELVKNQEYHFWDLAFTRAAPDIERVFEAISRSCLGTAPPIPSTR